MSNRKGKRRFLRYLLFGLLLIVAGAVIYWRIFWHLPVGDGPAGPDVPAEPFRRTWSDQPVLFLGVVDSMTTGFGAAPGEGYFARLTDNPSNEYAEMHGKCLRKVFPKLSVLNVAVSGSTGSQGQGLAVTLTIDQEPT